MDLLELFDNDYELHSSSWFIAASRFFLNRYLSDDLFFSLNIFCLLKLEGGTYFWVIEFLFCIIVFRDELC